MSEHGSVTVPTKALANAKTTLSLKTKGIAYVLWIHPKRAWKPSLDYARSETNNALTKPKACKYSHPALMKGWQVDP